MNHMSPVPMQEPEFDAPISRRAILNGDYLRGESCHVLVTSEG
jgi:hypothetical protein